MRNVVIECSGLMRRFGSVLAVDRLDLTVERGSVYAFLGPNGAGKTTTIRMLLGLIRPDGGHVRILGQAMPAERLTAENFVSNIEKRSGEDLSLGREGYKYVVYIPAADEEEGREKAELIKRETGLSPR